MYGKGGAQDQDGGASGNGAEGLRGKMTEPENVEQGDGNQAKRRRAKKGGGEVRQRGRSRPSGEERGNGVMQRRRGDVRQWGRKRPIGGGTW